MKTLVAPFGVECVDATRVRRKFPVRTLKGWELKSYSILHSPYREVLLLRFQEEMQLDEIAKIQATPISTVKSRLYRARENLKRMLGPLMLPRGTAYGKR